MVLFSTQKHEIANYTVCTSMCQHTLAVVGAPQLMGSQPWGNSTRTTHFLLCFACFAIGHQTCGQSPDGLQLAATAVGPAAGGARASAPFWHGGKAPPICPFAISLANGPPYSVGLPGATAHWGLGCKPPPPMQHAPPARCHLGGGVAKHLARLALFG